MTPIAMVAMIRTMSAIVTRVAVSTVAVSTAVVNMAVVSITVTTIDANLVRTMAIAALTVTPPVVAIATVVERTAVKIIGKNAVAVRIMIVMPTLLAMNRPLVTPERLTAAAPMRIVPKRDTVVGR
jgi:hypothetical protein